MLESRVRKGRPAREVTAGELVDDLMTLLTEKYDGRHLDVEVTQLALSSVAHQMIVMHLRAVAQSAD